MNALLIESSDTLIIGFKMDRLQKLQGLVFTLHNVANQMDEMGIEALSDHVDSIVDDLNAEIKMEIGKGPVVTLK